MRRWRRLKPVVRRRWSGTSIASRPVPLRAIATTPARTGIARPGGKTRPRPGCPAARSAPARALFSGHLHPAASPAQPRPQAPASDLCDALSGLGGSAAAAGADQSASDPVSGQAARGSATDRSVWAGSDRHLAPHVEQRTSARHRKLAPHRNRCHFRPGAWFRSGSGAWVGACRRAIASHFARRSPIIARARTRRRAGYVQRGLCGGDAPHESFIRSAALVAGGIQPCAADYTLSATDLAARERFRAASPGRLYRPWGEFRLRSSCTRQNAELTRGA